MALFIRHLTHALIFLALWGCLRAAEPARRPQIEVQFSVFGTRAFKGLAYLSSTSPKPRSVKFYSVTLSSLYTYRGDSSLKFYNETELVAALEEAAAEKKANPHGPEPELKIRPVAVCTIPDGLKKAVLLFFPSPQASSAGAEQCEIFAMDMAATKVPPGSMVIVNAAGHDFIGQINSQVVTINRGVSAPFRGDHGRISVKMVRQEPDFQNVVCSDEWPVGKNQRRLWILFPFENTTDILPNTCCLLEKTAIEEQGMQTTAVLP